MLLFCGRCGDTFDGEAGERFCLDHRPEPKLDVSGDVEEERVEIPIRSDPTAREHFSSRAGHFVHLNPATTDDVSVVRNGKTIVVGKIDRSRRVYLCGADSIGGLVYWKLRLFALDPAEWELVRQRADWIYAIDVGAEKVYRVAVQRAQDFGRVFSSKNGDRYGIPFDDFEILDGDGNPIP